MNKILLLVALSLTLLTADQIKIDTKLYQMNKFKYETPQGRRMRVPNRTELIVVAFEKDTGKLVNEYLKSKDPYYMPKRHAIYIADISNMPTIITNIFALPKLRKYKHPIYLHFDDEFGDFVPSKEEQITIIRVKNKKVTGISYVTTMKELQAAIEK